VFVVEFAVAVEFGFVVVFAIEFSFVFVVGFGSAVVFVFVVISVMTLNHFNEKEKR
jgi:hypothetical protein